MNYGFGSWSLLPTLWTPMTPKQPLVWLKADAGVSLSGAQVTNWQDQSGHGWNFAPRNSGIRPTYSATGWNGTKPGITFGSAYTELINQSAGLADQNPFSVKVYMTIDVGTSAGTQMTLVWMNLGGSFGVYQIQVANNVDQVTYSSGGVNYNGSALSGKVNTSYSLNHTTDGYTYSWINGVSSIVQKTSTPTATTDVIGFGGNLLLGNSALHGTIAEVVIYDTHSSDVDVLAQYNAYAKNRWGGL